MRFGDTAGQMPCHGTSGWGWVGVMIHIASAGSIIQRPAPTVSTGTGFDKAGKPGVVVTLAATVQSDVGW